MTLLEVMIALAVGAIVLGAVGKLSVFMARSFVALGNYNDLDQSSRNALDVLSREIRQAEMVTAYATNQLTFVDFDGAALTYTWNPNAHTLTRTKGVQSTVLLRQCDYLRFNMFQRNPTNGFLFYQASDPATAKLVDVSWRCSRQIFQQKANTESVQTSKIVIRN